MQDICLQNVCDHIMRDERSILVNVDGTSQWVHKLENPCSRGGLKVREWNTSEGLTQFVWLRDGITDFTLASDNQTLSFNTGFPLTVGINHVDGATYLVPQNEYLVTYSMVKASCFKCGGTGIVNDIYYNGLGKLTVVEGKSKLGQVVLKALLTSKGSNLEHPEYGSIIPDMIGKKLTEFILIQIQQSIQGCLSQIMGYQASFIDDLEPEEILLGIDQINVLQDETDPRKINIVVYYLNGAYDRERTVVQLSE